MEEVVVNGRPSANEFNSFKNLFVKSESGKNIATSEKVKKYFIDTKLDSFFSGLNSKPEYINLLKSGSVKIIETFNVKTNNYVYIVLDDKVNESNFAVEQAIFAIQIVQQ